MVDVGEHAGVHARVESGTAGADVIVAGVGVDKGRVAPDIDRAGEDGTLAAARSRGPVPGAERLGCVRYGAVNEF